MKDDNSKNTRWLKFTNAAIDSMKYEGRETSPGKFIVDTRWDTQMRGLGIRIFPTGTKSFVVRYEKCGRTIIKAIGRFGAITVEIARKVAQSKLGEHAFGKNPFAEEEKLAKRVPLKKLCDEYLSRYAKPHKKSWRNDEARIKRYIKEYWPNRYVQEISNSDVIKLHFQISKTAPYEANRTIEMLSVMFRLAIQWGYYIGDNPAKGIKHNKEQKRDRWITPDEMKNLAAALEKEKNIYVAKAVWLYLYTGARKSELLKAKWKDVDWERRELRFVDTKNGETHYVPLSEPALKILKDLPRVEGNDHMFPGGVEGAAFVNLTKAWSRIRTEAKVKDVRLHDLRRTVGSWFAQSGNSLHLIGKVLNHKNPATTAIYARFGQDVVRQALEDHGKKIAAVISGTGGEVIEFPDQEKKTGTGT